MSFAYFYLHHALDKNSHVEALYANSYGKIKSRKKSLGKENEKNRPKEERKSSILSRKEKKNLAESDKGSWFGQTPSTISASAEDPERSNILGASSLKIKVNVSAGCEQDSSSESGGSDEENETYPRELISAIRVFLKLSVDSLTSCFSAAHFPPLTFLARVLPLPLPLASLPIILRRRPELNSTERDKKNMLQCDAFPGKSWSIVIGTRRSCCSIGLRFY